MRNRKTGWKIAAVVFAAALICILLLILTSFRSCNGDNIISNVFSGVNDSEDEATTEGNSLPLNPVDFETLRETNEEIYAWLYVPDTIISYPVVQSYSDDS